MRRDPIFTVLGLLVVAVGAVLVAMVWPDSLTPSCSDPPSLPPGVTEIDPSECTNAPLRTAIEAFLPVAAAALLVTLGLTALAYGVRKHPRD